VRKYKTFLTNSDDETISHLNVASTFMEQEDSFR